MLRAPSLGLARRVSSTLRSCSAYSQRPLTRSTTSFAPPLTYMGAALTRRREHRRDAPVRITLAELQQAEEETLSFASGEREDGANADSAQQEDAARESENTAATDDSQQDPPRKRSHGEWCRLARLRILHRQRRQRQIERYFTPPPTSDKTPPYPASPFTPSPVKPLVIGPDGLGEVVYARDDDLVFMRDPPPDPATIPSTARALWRADILFFLQYTQSADDAWRAYSLLLAFPAPANLSPSHHKIPNAHLHRVARVLAHARPKTRPRFLRLLSVLAYLARQGGRVMPHEWNALIDGAAKGWRKTRAGDVRLAFDTFADMTAGRAPGASTLGEDDGEPPSRERIAPTEPDIHTYTTLLSAAARTLDPATVRKATSLLKSSGLPPNRITHLALLNYYTHTQQLSGVRATLRQLRLEGHPLGLDGLNAALWAFARSGRIDVVADAYRVLRHQLHPTQDDPLAIEELAARLRDAEALDLPPELKPNAGTWTTLVQAFAHHGDLHRALSAFRDMLSQVNDERGAPLFENEGGKLVPGHYAPAMPVLRALFLGFARHGSRRDDAASTRPQRYRGDLPTSPSAWTLDALLPILRVFQSLPAEPRPSRSTLFWILTAFRKTTGDRRDVVRKVWEMLEGRYGERYMVSQQRLRSLREWLYHPEGLVWEEGVESVAEGKREADGKGEAEVKGDRSGRKEDGVKGGEGKREDGE